MGIWNVKPRVRKLWRMLARRNGLPKLGKKGSKKYLRRYIYEARGMTRTVMSRFTAREMAQDRSLGIMPTSREGRRDSYICLARNEARPERGQT